MGVRITKVRARAWVIAALAAVACVVAACGSDNNDNASTGASSTPAASTPASGGGTKTTAAKRDYIDDFVAYTHGKAGAADMKLSPVKIGWSNNQDGSIISNGPQATAAAQFAADWVNKYAGGIDGHPLVLENCFIKNAEEEGKACAQKFLNDPAVKLIEYGSVTTGAQSLNSTNAGKKPLIEGFAQNPSDVTNPNTYILFAADPFSFYGYASFGKEVLKAKTAAVLYANGAGFFSDAQAIKEGAQALGIKTKLVGFNPNSTDLVGALVAAGADHADMVAPIVGGDSTCVAMDRGLKQLNVDPGKVVGIFTCALASQQKAYGGDIPKWYFGIAQSGDHLTDNPTGVAYRKALADFGQLKNKADIWWTGMYGVNLTIAQFLNDIAKEKGGVDKITPDEVAAKAKAFRGPLLFGGPKAQCGKYPKSPANCGDGSQFFRYTGDLKFEQYPQWFFTPAAEQKKLGAIDAG